MSEIKSLLIAICLACALNFFSTSAQAQKGPCSCEDARDLFNRLNEANAAVAEYKVQILGIWEREKKDGERLAYSDELYNKILQPRIQAAINRVTDSKARKATAKTQELKCQTNFNAPTECLRQVLDKHEEVHRKACNARVPVVERLYLADFAQEEIDAYNAEINYILTILQSLPKLCLPQMWFGTITTTRTISEKTAKKTRTGKEVGVWQLLLGGEALNSIVPSGTTQNNPQLEAIQQALKKAQEQLQKSGLDNLLSRTDVAVDINRQTTWKGGGNECCGSDTGESPNINESEEDYGVDHAQGNVTVTLFVGKFTLTFPGVSIDGQKRRKTEVISSPCPYDKSSNEVTDEKLSLAVPKLETTAASQIVGNVEVLSGSKTTSAGADKITYEWNLKRFIK